MLKNYCLDERIRLLPSLFGIRMIDYNRVATGVCFSFGCGIGIALMDSCPNELRYFLDIDSYRKSLVDWESVGVVLDSCRPSVIVLAGWFSLDRPHALLAVQRSVERSRVVFYEGGANKSLQDAIDEIKRLQTKELDLSI
jgi:hypothetical protein